MTGDHLHHLVTDVPFATRPLMGCLEFDRGCAAGSGQNPCGDKRVFDLMKDFGTSKSTKIDSIFDSLLVP
ncbi:MAG: hypothetical protein ABW068_15715, partial [Candidatus Thiodiazotropha sp.]